MEHIRQSRPDPGLHFQVKVLETFQVVPSFLESGEKRDPRVFNSAGECYKATVERAWHT